MALEDLMSAPGTSGLSVAGEMGSEELVALQKALTAGYGSDTNGLTGGSAFRIQSLDTTLKATVQENKHFALFNALAKPKATAVVAYIALKRSVSTERLRRIWRAASAKLRVSATRTKARPSRCTRSSSAARLDGLPLSTCGSHRRR